MGITARNLCTEGGPTGADPKETAGEVSAIRDSLSSGPGRPDFGDVGFVADFRGGREPDSDRKKPEHNLARNNTPVLIGEMTAITDTIRT